VSRVTDKSARTPQAPDRSKVFYVFGRIPSKSLNIGGFSGVEPEFFDFERHKGTPRATFEKSRFALRGGSRSPLHDAFKMKGKVIMQLRYMATIPLALAFLSATALTVGCGDSSSPATTVVSLSISDAPAGEVDEVAVTIDRIVFTQPGDDIEIEEFVNNDDPEGDLLDTVTIDLLDYQGMASILVIEGLELEVGEYQNMILYVLDEDTDLSWVVEAGETERKDLKVPSGRLQLGRFEVEDVGEQNFVIEFNLTQSLVYRPGASDMYNLTPRGVRIVDVEAAVIVAGAVDPTLFDGESPCDEKVDPELGNVVYLYEGHGHETDTLGDLFDPEIDTDAAAELIPPFASEPVSGDGDFVFSYLPAGDYTLGFSCDAEDDDPEFDDGIVIPTPDGEVHEVSLEPGDEFTCNFPVSEGDCTEDMGGGVEG